MSGSHPGVALIKRIFDFCSTLHPKTKVMVSGIREKEGMPLAQSAASCQLPAQSL